MVFEIPNASTAFNKGVPRPRRGGQGRRILMMLLGLAFSGVLFAQGTPTPTAIFTEPPTVTGTPPTPTLTRTSTVTPTVAAPTATPTVTSTVAAPTATPTAIAPTATQIPGPGGPSPAVPTLSFPMLALLALAIGGAAVLLIRRL